MVYIPVPESYRMPYYFYSYSGHVSTRGLDRKARSWSQYWWEGKTMMYYPYYNCSVSTCGCKASFTEYTIIWNSTSHDIYKSEPAYSFSRYRKKHE